LLRGKIKKLFYRAILLMAKNKVNQDSIHFMLDSDECSNTLWYLMSDENASEEMHGNFSFIVIENNKKVSRTMETCELLCDEYIFE
jgi:hypothetical protein